MRPMLPLLFPFVTGLLLTLSPATAVAEDKGWIDLFGDNPLAAWKGPTRDWQVAGGAQLDARNPRRLVATPGKGVLVNSPKGRAHDLISKQVFGDVDVHVEFLISKGSNSGVKLQGLYEVQMYDSWGVKKPKASDCGGIYPRAELKPRYHHIDKGYPPRSNAARRPGEWQTLDIIFLAPRFDAAGKKTANACFLKVVLNGTVIHEDVKVPTPTGHAWHDKERATGPLLLQGDHGPVAFRNVRVRPRNTTPTTAPGAGGVRHPNLLLNRQEIAQVKEKIKKHPWAAQLFDQVKKLADDPRWTGRCPREAALVYVLTGDKRYADRARNALVGGARGYLAQYDRLDLNLNPDFGSWGPWATWAWAYDLTYDTFSAEQRLLVERLLRTAARTIIAGLKLRPTTPNLVFEKHWKVGLIGYCLGDKELIDWALNHSGGAHGPQRGGFYAVLDSMVKDGYFWGEAPIYALHMDVHGMLGLAEAARHYDGSDLYHYVSKKSGGSIKGLIDGYLRLAYPLEKTGIGRGSLRMATFGDGSTSYSPRGELHDTFLVNPPSRVFGEPTLSGELEVAYLRYKDPGYAWLLKLNPRRDQYIGPPGQGNVRPVWGYIALTHGQPLPEEPTPPPAPSGVYPGQGFAMLRADETPHYWTSGAAAAVLRLGDRVGHGHEDYFHLILHGKGRLLYPDLNVIQYEPSYLHWTHEGIAHNTLLVDHRSPRPGPFTTRHDFAPGAKFFAITGSAFPGVTQMRALLLTPEYVADVFHVADEAGVSHTYDWILHGLGRLCPGNPAAYRPTEALVPHYWWIDNERSRKVDGTWRADWIQQSAGVTPGVQPFGKEWFAQTVGVRLTMLDAKDTTVYTGEGPLVDGPPYHRIDGSPEGSSPMVVARRHAAATTFSAVHEPYDRRPVIRHVWRLEEAGEAVGLGIESNTFSDRVLVAFRPGKSHTLRTVSGEAFHFEGNGFVRITRDRLTARGALKAFRVRAPGRGKLPFTLNGKEAVVERVGAFLEFGKPDDNPVPAAGEASARDAPEKLAAVHYSFLPEEVHLRTGGAGETVLRLRCVGDGAVRGTLRLTPPRGVTVQPGAVALDGMTEGEEKVVRLKVKATAGASAGLYPVRIAADRNGRAAAGTLLVSVGVVQTLEDRIPFAAQSVIRAPGYTMRVDQVSGVSYSLLDADGHRRHGMIHNTNFCNGIPALVRDGKWAFRYRLPCRFLWDGRNSITVGSGADGEFARLRYTFLEDRIVLRLIAPTSPRNEYTMWLGNFDALGTPQPLGSAKDRGGDGPAVWFFPHPIHRQGLLLTLPPKARLEARGTAVSFPLRLGQDVTLRFATAEEAAK